MNFCYLYCSEKMNHLHLFIYTFYSFKTVLETTLFCAPCTSQKENRVVKFIFVWWWRLECWGSSWRTLPTGSAPGRPLWGTMTRWEDKDLHRSLMNLRCRKWKQSLARSKAAPQLMKWEEIWNKNSRRVSNYWGAAQMKVIILVPP